MSKVPKLPLSRLHPCSTPAISTSPLKAASRKTSLCPTPQRSQSLETSALHFQPRGLKSLAHERVLYKTLRLIQTDRERASLQPEEWGLKVNAVATQWTRMSSLGRRKNQFSIVGHFAGSPRRLSAERVANETPQRLLSLAEATNTALKQALKAVLPDKIAEKTAKSTRKVKVFKPEDARRSRTQCIEVPKLRETKKTATEPPVLPQSSHTKSCAQLPRNDHKRPKASLLSRLQTPVLTGRK